MKKGMILFKSTKSINGEIVGLAIPNEKPWITRIKDHLKGLEPEYVIQKVTTGKSTWEEMKQIDPYFRGIQWMGPNRFRLVLDKKLTGRISDPAEIMNLEE